MKKEKLLEVLCRACDRPLEWNTELLQSGYLDSLAMVLLEEELEMAGESISVARIPREALGTPMTLWDWYRMNTQAGKRGHLSRVNAQKSKNIFYEARMRAISSRKSCSEHR